MMDNFTKSKENVVKGRDQSIENDKLHDLIL